MAQRIITNGPNKFDLMLALFDTEGRKVEFTITLDDSELVEISGAHDAGNFGEDIVKAIAEIPPRVEAQILSVEREDGTGESWMLTGRLGLVGHPRFKAHFNTRTRGGSLTTVAEEPQVFTVYCANCNKGHVAAPKRCHRCREMPFRSAPAT